MFNRKILLFLIPCILLLFIGAFACNTSNTKSQTNSIEMEMTSLIKSEVLHEITSKKYDECCPVAFESALKFTQYESYADFRGKLKKTIKTMRYPCLCRNQIIERTNCILANYGLYTLHISYELK